MIDILLVVLSGLLAVLLASTTVRRMEYHKQLRRAQKEYEKARDSVEDVVLSFNRELRREAERHTSWLTYKAEKVLRQKRTAGLREGGRASRKELSLLKAKLANLAFK